MRQCYSKRQTQTDLRRPINMTITALPVKNSRSLNVTASLLACNIPIKKQKGNTSLRAQRSIGRVAIIFGIGAESEKCVHSAFVCIPFSGNNQIQTNEDQIHYFIFATIENLALFIYNNFFLAFSKVKYIIMTSHCLITIALSSNFSGKLCILLPPILKNQMLFYVAWEKKNISL